MALRDFFATHPVFATADLAEYRQRNGSDNRWTRMALLAHHRNQGRLVQVRRGLYAVAPPGADAATFTPDPFLVAAKLRADSVVAFHSALELHGRANSVFNTFYFLTGRAPEPFVFRGLQFQGIGLPKVLVAKGQEAFAVTEVDRLGLPVKVTRLERTLVDVLDRPKLGGGWEEIWRSLEAVEFFDLDTVVEYTLLLDNATTAAKVGYFLERHRDALMVEDGHLAPLRKRRPKQPHYMDVRNRARGRLAPEWNLVVPVEVADRVWEASA